MGLNSRVEGGIGLIGGGKIACGLAAALAKAGYQVTLLKADGHAIEQQLEENPAIALSHNADGFLADHSVFILAVNDDALAQVDRAFPWPAGAVVFHCSGAQAGSELVNAAQRGCHVGSLHFVTSIADASRAAIQFEKVPLVVEGGQTCVDTARLICSSFADPVLKVSAENKRLHHIACMFSVNFTAALIGHGLDIWKEAGIDSADALPMLQRLLGDFQQNLEVSGVVGALTGPLVRGDFDTIRGHLERLQDFSGGIRNDFIHQCMNTARLLRKADLMSEAQLDTLEKLLAW